MCSGCCLSVVGISVNLRSLDMCGRGRGSYDCDELILRDGFRGIFVLF